MQEEENKDKNARDKNIPDYVKYVFSRILVIVVCVVFTSMLIMAGIKTFLPKEERHYEDVFTQILN